MPSRLGYALVSGLFSCGLFVACNGFFGKREPSHARFDSLKMYDCNAVLAFVRSGGGAPKENFFSQGVDEYRNKTSLSAARTNFIRSICSYPTPRAYYELGNVSLDMAQYREAIDAYKIAEQLGYEPVSKLMYNLACAYSKMGVADSSLSYLEYAIESGYTNAKNIKGDPDLAYVRNTGMFNYVYLKAMAGVGDPETMLWQTFKREFPAATLPLTLENKPQVEEMASISYEFEKFVSEMRNEKFSRDVGMSFYYCSEVDRSANHTTLLYASQDAFLEETAPYQYTMVSFDNKGILIDKMVVAGQLSPADSNLTCTIAADRNFSITYTRNVYQDPPQEKGYENNPILRVEDLGKANFRIDSTGKFVYVADLPLSAR